MVWAGTKRTSLKQFMLHFHVWILLRAAHYARRAIKPTQTLYSHQLPSSPFSNFSLEYPYIIHRTFIKGRSIIFIIIDINLKYIQMLSCLMLRSRGFAPSFWTWQSHFPREEAVSRLPFKIPSSHLLVSSATIPPTTVLQRWNSIANDPDSWWMKKLTRDNCLFLGSLNHYIQILTHKFAATWAARVPYWWGPVLSWIRVIATRLLGREAHGSSVVWDQRR